MYSTFHLAHWRQHVALDVGTAGIRIATGMSAVAECLSRIGGRLAMRGGVVADADALSRILRPMLDRARVLGIVRPCVLTCAPSDVSAHERKMLVDAVKDAGAASVTVIPEPLAAAIGAGLDVSAAFAQMVVDIGEGVTDCAVIASSKIKATEAVRTGCACMRRAIDDAFAAANARPEGWDSAAYLCRCGILENHGQPGRSLAASALLPVIDDITDMIDAFVKRLPPEIGCEIIESGICLTGGGALIPGMREAIEQRTGISVFTAKSPRVSVVEGARSILPVVMYLNQWK